ncbi:hypothetical protein K1719_040040 [Acacia pycnantha]|nr:hypothetical protein K1719_040040 [Acacia pycnantha]
MCTRSSSSSSFCRYCSSSSCSTSSLGAEKTNSEREEEEGLEILSDRSLTGSENFTLLTDSGSKVFFFFFST